MKINVDLGGIIGLAICFLVLLRANNIVFKYIAFAGFIYLLKNNNGGK